MTAWARDAVAELAARAALTCRPLERVLVAVCHRPRLRRLLKAGAVAVSYPNLLHRAERRAIDTGAFKLVVDLAEHRGAHAYFFESPQPSWILDHIIKPGAICADVGANVGLYTCALARLVGPRGLILAVEPHPSAFRSLELSVAANGFDDRVVAERVALYSRSGEAVTLYLLQESELASVVRESDTRIEVRSDTLDRLAKRHGIDRFNFVKIDVEDAEADVLAGGEGLLRKQAVDNVLIEMRAHQLAHGMLRSCGYRGYLVRDTDRRLEPAANLGDGHFGDFVFVAPGHLAEFRSTFHMAEEKDAENV